MKILLALCVFFSPIITSSEYINLRKRNYYAAQLDQGPDDLRTHVPLRDKSKILFQKNDYFKVLLDTNLYRALQMLQECQYHEKVSLIHENVTVLHTDESNQNLLHYACFIGNLEIVKILLQYTPELAHASNINNETPLDVAYYYEQENIVTFFKQLQSKN